MTILSVVQHGQDHPSAGATMDPEIYVFPNIRSAPLKIAASTARFILVLTITGLITPLLPGPQLWAAIDRTLTIAGSSVSVAKLLHILIGYTLFIYGEPVVGVVGGLHYEKVSAEGVQPHIQFLASRQPKLIALSPHDSSPEALAAFHLAFSEAYQFIKVGDAIQFP